MAGTQQSADRARPMVTFTLSRGAIVRLIEMAKRMGQSRSATVEALIRDATMPPPKKDR